MVQDTTTQTNQPENSKYNWWLLIIILGLFVPSILIDSLSPWNALAGIGLAIAGIWLLTKFGLKTGSKAFNVTYLIIALTLTVYFEFDNSKVKTNKKESNSKIASLTCRWCQKTFFAKSEGKSLSVYSKNRNGECYYRGVYSGSHNGFCTLDHCRLYPN